MGKPKIKGRAGVAFFGKLSLERDLKAFEWAYKHLPLSDEYKLRIIHVNELNNGNQPQERPDSRYDEYDDVETKFVENYPYYSKMGELQTKMKAHHVHKYICGVAYEGENFEAALQHAIVNEGLDTLVLAWWEADDTKGPPINRLESEGCSIILHKVDSKKLTVSMPPTPPMASTDGSIATATAPSSMMPALTNQASNDEAHTTSSTENTQCPDGRALAALSMASTEVSASIPPAAPATATMKGSNSKRTPKAAPNKAQSASSGSEIDSRRPGGRREKDAAHKETAEPSRSGKTKIV